MLMERKLVLVPAQPEIDADLGEYGHLGAKCRAAYGQAGAEAASPDYGANDPATDGADAIANVLHWIADQSDEDAARGAVSTALMNYEAERAGDE